jgi:TM2 domain-containing membrane protein YozV
VTDQIAQAAQASAATMMRYDANKKSMPVSYLLWFFLGGFGAHRFYNGRTGSAIAQIALLIVGGLTSLIGVGLVLFVALGVWALVDAFLIPGRVGAHNNRWRPASAPSRAARDRGPVWLHGAARPAEPRLPAA